jgi:hypothetical protein
MRITIAVLVLAAAAGIACLAGNGSGYTGCLILVVWFLALSSLDPRTYKYVWLAFLWASVGAALIAVIQLPVLDRPRGPFGSPNYLGAFAAIMLFVAWRERGTIAGNAALGANAVALVLAQSRGAILAAGAGAVALLGRRRPILSGTIICGALLGAVLLQRPESRLAVWQLGLTLGLQRPLTGWGIGGVSNIFLVDGGLMHLDHFYSVPLDWFVATGMVGLAAALWLVAEAWMASAKTEAPGQHRAILTAWIVQGLFLSAAWPIWLVLFALLADISRATKRGGANLPVDPTHAPGLDSGRTEVALRPR